MSIQANIFSMTTMMNEITCSKKRGNSRETQLGYVWSVRLLLDLRTGKGRGPGAAGKYNHSIYLP